MHPQCKQLIERMLPDRKGEVLDIGSMDINGSLKDMFNECEYTGIDIAEGKNVDVVVQPFSFPFPDETFDIVVSANCLEHVPEPGLWAKEVKRVLKKGGQLAITAPHKIHIHNRPDYWRIMPDAMRYLFNGMDIIECDIGVIDTYLLAKKI
jgi:ubiquinone/menaquinone biosynthesis C-methylase UbiE